jgi:hypothetical protein
MIALFPKLEDAGFFEKYYPSNSHEALGISTEREYSLRLTKPMVYILYIPGKQNFELHFQKGQANTLLQENCGPIVLPEVLIKINRWLTEF